MHQRCVGARLCYANLLGRSQVRPANPAYIDECVDSARMPDPYTRVRLLAT